MSIMQGSKIHRPKTRHAEVDDWCEEAVDLSKWVQPQESKNPNSELDADDPKKIGYLVDQTVHVRSKNTRLCYLKESSVSCGVGGCCGGCHLGHGISFVPTPVLC